MSDRVGSGLGTVAADEIEPTVEAPDEVEVSPAAAELTPPSALDWIPDTTAETVTPDARPAARVPEEALQLTLHEALQEATAVFPQDATLNAALDLAPLAFADDYPVAEVLTEPAQEAMPEVECEAAPAAVPDEVPAPAHDTAPEVVEAELWATKPESVPEELPAPPAMAAAAGATEATEATEDTVAPQQPMAGAAEHSTADRFLRPVGREEITTMESLPVNDGARTHAVTRGFRSDALVDDLNAPAYTRKYMD